MKQFVILYCLVLLSGNIFAVEPASAFKFYGFIRNDFQFNSRLNEEGIDGIFNYYPKPASINSSGVDENAVPHAEMLSVATRLGVDYQGKEIFGAKTIAKIEMDFAGTGATYYLIRIRQAFMQFNWNKSSLLVGQTWHPLFGSVSPTMVSFNAGVPFQPFNRSPQIRYNGKITDQLSYSAAAIYQMQYTSNGPNGFSQNYMKNGLLPNLFAGLEYKNKNLICGIGLDYKKIKPDTSYISSLSGVAYVHYTKSLFQAKAKAILGQNLSDLMMTGGYGKAFDSSSQTYYYTNLNAFSSWVNFVYGKQWQVGLFGGFSKNLGSQMDLFATNGKYTVYGRGFYSTSQEMLNRLYRVAPCVMYNNSGMTIGLEYNLTSAQYGTMQADGMVSNPYEVVNHRIVGVLIYNF